MTTPRARKIADPEEAVATPQQNAAPKGVTFIKNQVNELLKFKGPDGKQMSFVFPASRFTTNDAVLIKGIRSVAKRSGIIEEGGPAEEVLSADEAELQARVDRKVAEAAGE